MLEKYPRLVETVIEFKRFSRRILAEHKGKHTLLDKHYLGFEYIEKQSEIVIDMASNYRLQYNESDDTYYCLEGQQTFKYHLWQINALYII